jgi:hypothetical protein
MKDSVLKGSYCHASEGWHPVFLCMEEKLDASLRWHDNSYPLKHYLSDLPIINDD